jgi:hypothetical protein
MTVRTGLGFIAMLGLGIGAIGPVGALAQSTTPAGQDRTSDRSAEARPGEVPVAHSAQPVHRPVLGHQAPSAMTGAAPQHPLPVATAGHEPAANPQRSQWLQPKTGALHVQPAKPPVGSGSAAPAGSRHPATGTAIIGGPPSTAAKGSAAAINGTDVRAKP